MYSTVREALFGDEDIYAGFPLQEYPLDRHTWGGTDPIFGRLIAEVRPSRIIEAGTWRGWSAITMARACREHNVDCREIVCVDTWLGADTHLVKEQDGTVIPSPMRTALNRRFGFPRIYDQFLANVIHTGCHDLIVPFAAPTDVAGSVLRTIGLQAELIYLDANHSYDSVATDLRSFWPLLAPGGVFIAHDYATGFPGCRLAIDEFSESHGLTRYVEREWCLLVK